MNPVLVVLLALATYRVSRIITAEEGPFGVFAIVRGKIDPNQSTWVGRGLACVLCVSFWIGLVFAALIGATWLEWLAACGLIVMWREAIST